MTSLRFFFPLLLVALLDSSYGQTPTQSADLYPSGYIDMMDLFVLSANWKDMERPSHGDLDRNGMVGPEDLLAVLGEWHKSSYISVDIPGLPEEARKMKLVRIPAGTFQMGSPDTERGRYSDEGPVHTVHITHDFYIGETEVTQAQWKALMGSNPATDLGYTHYGVGNDYPVYYVSWNDITKANGFLSRLDAQSSYNGFRLPTEAEWEYACRAGTQSRYSFGDNLYCDDYCSACPLADQFMWRCGNSGRASHPVASKLPNAFGLYDMHGNVFEWCQDYWHHDYSGAPTDGSAWLLPHSIARVFRGGSWDGYAWYSRSAFRLRATPVSFSSGIGFRVVLPVSP